MVYAWVYIVPSSSLSFSHHLPSHNEFQASSSQVCFMSFHPVLFLILSVDYWCKRQLVHNDISSSAIVHSVPGPIEVADEVLFANAHPSMSHVSPEFVPVFGDCIRMIRYTSCASNQISLISHSERYYSQKTLNPSLSVGAELLAGTKFVQSFVAFP